jgi:hypothetical protein
MQSREPACVMENFEKFKMHFNMLLIVIVKIRPLKKILRHISDFGMYITDSNTHHPQ